MVCPELERPCQASCTLQLRLEKADHWFVAPPPPQPQPWPDLRGRALTLQGPDWHQGQVSQPWLLPEGLPLPTGLLGALGCHTLACFTIQVGAILAFSLRPNATGCHLQHGGLSRHKSSVRVLWVLGRHLPVRQRGIQPAASGSATHQL